MKGTLLLCIGFILMQLGMVVFDVEYWPFSGYGVYRKVMALDTVQVTRLSLKSEGEEPEWLYTEDEYRKNKVFFDRASFILRKRPELLRIMMAEHLPKARALASDRPSTLRLEQIRVEKHGEEIIFKRDILHEVSLD